ncbi:MAG: hypothetical protein GF383_15850 [Candidatus Lokiarchaeota archaeon]|nr:hypothetical protein [Candidatus Lokiarchaeota archaeon]
MKGADKFFFMLNLFGSLKPYNTLNNREKQVFAELMYYNEQLKDLDERKRNVLIFDYDTRQEIANKYDLSIASVYNIMSSLKKKGFLGKSYLVDRYLFKDEEQIIIQFNGK